jgi:predicted transcriptional regulator
MATTLKLPAELKDRVSKVIEGTGQTAHAFMIDAIRTQTENAEKRRDFTTAALAARKEFARTGAAYAMEDIHPYIKGRASGKKTPKPKPRRWRA